MVTNSDVKEFEREANKKVLEFFVLILAIFTAFCIFVFPLNFNYRDEILTMVVWLLWIMLAIGWATLLVDLIKLKKY